MRPLPRSFSATGSSATGRNRIERCTNLAPRCHPLRSPASSFLGFAQIASIRL
ncbi:hypothetical protein HMPREF9946_02520 [Acetobacteraceae bacterium AT-5844]|nr:hypothetical protein HMPREF9946_02520 [Acetobacteraceae bacterium AT-5844]